MNPTPLAVGTAAPAFTLTDMRTGQAVSLAAGDGQVQVLVFWSAECPWAHKYDAYFTERAAQWQAQGVPLLMIVSNWDETDAQVMAKAQALGLAPAALLRDMDNIIADAYGAVVTPHIFVVDQAGQIAYEGAIDDRTFQQREATINYLDEALAGLAAGQQPPFTRGDARGCTINRRVQL